MNIKSLFKNAQSTGMFVPTGIGSFRELTEPFDDSSLDNIGKGLGYNSESLHGYFADLDPTSDIKIVLVELFTKNVVFVCTDPRITKVSQSKVDSYLARFDPKKEYNAIATEEVLSRGIANRSLTSAFLGRVLKLVDPEPNGVYFSESLGLYLYFNEGVLTDFSSSDGLNQWAKHWNSLNPDFIANYERVARLYWGDNRSKIVSEVNVQAEALANAPETLSNQYADLHQTEYGTVNWFMLLATHYAMPITLPLFTDINHGRYEPLSEELGVYMLGNFVYRFDEEGKLIECSIHQPTQPTS